MRFGLVDAAKKDFPVQRLWKVPGVSASGYFAWTSCPAFRRQRENMVLLAHVRSTFTPFRSPPSQRSGRTRSGAPTSPTPGPARAGSTLPASSSSSPARRLGNQRSAPQRTAIVGSAPGHRRAASCRRLIHHADRGSQYCSLNYQAELRKNGIVTSMSGKGNCFDNGMVETFFKTLKAELVWRTVFQNRTEATAAIGRRVQ